MNTVRFGQDVIQNAEKIVDECMGLEDSFCKSGCPMSTDVKSYVKLISQGNFEEAVKVIRQTLFLPNTLGRICAHPCEGECRREKELGQAISIAALKRFAAEKADKKSIWDIEAEEPTGKNVAVIGSGPAGAQAAIDLRRKGHAVTIYEKENACGGMLRTGIPAYRLPKEVVDFEYSYLELLGVQIRYGVRIGEDLSFAALREQYDAVLIANGAQRGNRIQIPGNDAKDVYTAVEFLKEINETSAFPVNGKRVIVIGGGDVAMDCASSAIRAKAVKVMQCSLESEKELPASKEELNQAVEEGVVCNFGWGPDEILVKNGVVIGIRVRKVTAVFDTEGNFHPQYADETMDIPADTVIMAAGQMVEDVTDGAVAQGRGGRYQIDPETLSTELQDVFAAGDAAGGKIAIEAMALGRKAAISIDRFLKGVDLKENRDFTRECAHETRLDLPLSSDVTDQPRVSRNVRAVKERILDFNAVDLGFTEAQAKEEASRCLECGCGKCMKECIMLNEYGSCPKEIFTPLAGEGKLDMKLAYSCNDCDSCKTVCPKELPVKEVLMDARKDFVTANHGEPPLSGHRVVKIHQTLGFSSVFTTKVQGGLKS